MRVPLSLMLLFISASICVTAQTTKSDEQALVKITPLTLVEQQLNAYNARNIEDFLAPYSDSVEIYIFPDKLMSKGKEAMRRTYEGFFKQIPNLHCEIKSRMVLGNTVIDKESVTGMGSKPMEAIAIYKIEGEKIEKVYFVE